MGRSFNGQLFSEYMESVGSVALVPDGLGIYRWDIPQHKLPLARRELESSGLVLSAENKL